MKRILIPTDFSVQAENALKIAIELAKKNDSEITLLHSMEMPVHLATTDRGQLPEALYFVKLAEKRFSDLLEKPYIEHAHVTTKIGQGEIYDDINETVAEENIDLIIMGSHGASGFKEMFIGSNTEKVVRTSDIPVLVIKNDRPEFEIKDFVFATDFSEECRKPLKKAEDFAESFGATLHLLYVNTPSGFKTTSEANQMMKAFIKGTNLQNYTLNIYNDLSVEKGILNFATENKAQLIGMSTHGRKGIAHFFNGSISEDLVNHADMPVITFKI